MGRINSFFHWTKLLHNPKLDGNDIHRLNNFNRERNF